MANAVIYARYSSRGQNEQTIEGQIRVCTEYAQTHKLKIIGKYVDKGKTGTNDNRPEFQRMISDSAYGRFDVVIVYMVDRFARNHYDSTIYNFQLMRNGVTVVSATENISQSEEGEFYRMFLEWNAEKYSTRLSKRVKEGVTTSVANGTYTGGYIIAGYKVVDKRVLLDDVLAPVVFRIFKEYAQGHSKKEIAEGLNNDGFRLNGKLWNARNFDRMLTNVKYTGKCVIGGRVANNTYPAIIDEYTFDICQKRLQANRYFAGANSAKADYLLQGKIWCGHCGNTMTGDCATNKIGVVYYYYSCSLKRKKHQCDKKVERKDVIERYVVEQAVKYLSNEQRLGVVASDVIKYYQSRTNTDEIKRINAEISRVNKEIENATNIMISGVSSEVVAILNTKIVELSTQVKDLKCHRTQIEAEGNLNITKKDIIQFVKEFTNGDVDDVEFQKRIINNLINAVYLYDDKVIIYFNVHSGQDNTPVEQEKCSDSNALGLPSELKLEQVAGCHWIANGHLAIFLCR